MANPEQDAFRNRDHVDETQKQLQEASGRLLEDSKPSDKVAHVGRVGDSGAAESGLMGSLSRASELAGRLPTEMLTAWIDDAKKSGVFERSLLAGIDPRDNKQREDIMNLLARAVQSA